MKTGIVDVIMGPMFCGKSDEISRRLRRDNIAGRSFAVLKPIIDDRFGQNVYRDRNHTFTCEAITIPLEFEDKSELNDLLLRLSGVEVVAIDEAQFFGQWIIPFVLTLKAFGKKVYIGGLDTDYLNEPFGFMGDLCCIADNVLKLKAVCMVCGEDAGHTQRLIDGSPAPSGDKIVIGDKAVDENNISYEARCSTHYIHPSKVEERTHS